MQEIHEPPMTGDLDWLAFCYVADELADSDRAAFEARLADDQAAREAVAHAVELTQAVAVMLRERAEPHRPVLAPAAITRRTTWPRRLAWMSVGASAALVLVAVALNWRTIAGRFDSTPVDYGQLAEVWSQTRDEVRQIVQNEPFDLPPVIESDEFSSDDSLPSWITAAVFNEPAGADLDGPSTHDES